MADVIDTLKNMKLFDEFLSALDAAGLTEQLREVGPFTVFAPTDAAFSKILPSQLDELKRDRTRIRNILLFHIVNGCYGSDDLDEYDQIPTLQGDPVGIHIGPGFDVDVATFTRTDIEASNGIIHAIDTIIVPEVDAKLYGKFSLS